MNTIKKLHLYFIKTRHYLLFLLLFGCLNLGYAFPSVIEVNTANLPATNDNTFTTINFTTPFAEGTIPNVFPMTDESNLGPCLIRVQNVTNTGFEAACIEASNENRITSAMSFDYIAVQNGTTVVPEVGGADNVTFESGCSTTSTFVAGPNCDNCAGTGGFGGSTTFPSAFSATPALLTALQTTNNKDSVNPTDPQLIDVAIQTGSVSSTGFTAAIELMESGDTPISAERICYLAVETNSCKNLDFSSLGGPSSVTFNAVNGTNNIDGHDNLCTGSEGVTFTNGCFTSTPIAVAGKLTRRGNNGGFLRSCSVNSTRIQLTFDEDRFSDIERSHIDETASALAFSAAFSTPVTLNNAKVSTQGRSANFNWQTSAESFHLGFHLWGLVNDEWVQLNRKLIAGNGKDQFGVKNYQHRVRLTREQKNTISQFGISSVDNSGYEEFFGPFTVDQEYGEQVINEPVDWQQTRAKYEAQMVQKGYVKINGRWYRSNRFTNSIAEFKDLGLYRKVISFKAEKAGITQVNADDILNNVPAWRNMPLSLLAVSLNGKGVARHIISDDNLLNAGDKIIFYAQKPTSKSAIYLDSFTYQVRIDSNLAINASQFDGTPSSAEYMNSGIFAEALTSEKAHSPYLVADEPWYDHQLFRSNDSISKDYTFDLDELAELNKAMTIKLNVSGGVDFDGDAEAEPDHHLQVLVNDQVVSDIRFDGVINKSLTIDTPVNILRRGANTLTVSLINDTGYSADIVLIDDIQIEYFKQLSGQTNLAFKGSSENTGNYNTELESGLQPQIYGYDQTGNLAVINNASFENNELTFAKLPHSERSYYAVGNSWQEVEEFTVTRPAPIHKTASDFIIVAHPAFIGDSLNDYLETKRSQGYKPTLLNWLDIVSTYGYGNNTPAALRHFLKLASKETNIKNVLLVGGSTFDYRSITEPNVVNFIPSDYRPVDIFRFTPTDNTYADIDDDNIPDMAIGRWPVRSIEDLEKVIKKSNDWKQFLYDSNYYDSILISQKKDGRGLDFDSQVDTFLQTPLSRDDRFQAPNLVSMQAIEDSGEQQPVAFARQKIKESIDNGSHLVSFAGHASTAVWGFQGVVNTQFIQQLENSGKPTVVMPLACYTTYFESTSTNSLAHQWLFAGDKGAVAIHGASVLGEYRENAVFASRYLNQAADAATIGEAILKAKQEMATNNSMLHNWVLLGDPTLPLK